MDRRFPIGAELGPDAAYFRVWAPASRTAAVEIFSAGGASERVIPLQAESGGYYAGRIPGLRAGTLYKIQIDGGSFPDPASRFQPDGPHGPSELVVPEFAWTDQAWRGRPARDWVIYELHLGTFTSEGTWRAAQARLPQLAETGITMLEVMPIAEFPGTFGWGYDGVDLFAPAHIYGPPDDVRAFINRAHELGIAVILDVVYNHVGPDGNYLAQFAPEYFSQRYKNEWGEPLNFDGEKSGPVREFFVTNARYWIEEFHFDGLRLDATQQLYDASPTHVLAEIATVTRRAAGERTIALIAENECQHARLARPASSGGYGLDAIWNDDFHHTILVAATGRREAYFSDYRGTAQEIVSAMKYGFLYQGQWYRWQKQRRGQSALDLPPRAFVHFLQNHDQVANTLRGLRLQDIASAGSYRALTALLLLGPQIPLLFQGQEFAATAPFLYFADHEPDLAKLVAQGRSQFLSQFPSFHASDPQTIVPAPHEAATFQRCKLDWSERERHGDALRLHADLLRMRREDRVIAEPARIDGAVFSDEAFVLRFFGRGEAGDRLLLVNLGPDFEFQPAPEPLLAPLAERGWEVSWSSEAPAYGGCGTPPVETTSFWLLPGHAAVLLSPHSNRELHPARLSEKD
jgi:maltooligosyltrehalose trehalohydrolase